MKKLIKFTFSQDQKTIFDIAIDKALKLCGRLVEVTNDCILVFQIDLEKDKEFCKFLYKNYHTEFYKGFIVPDYAKKRSRRPLNLCDSDPSFIYGIVAVPNMFGTSKLPEHAGLMFASFMRYDFDIECASRHRYSTELIGKLEYKDIIKSVDI